MTDDNLFYCPCAPFMYVQLPPQKVAELFFDNLVILDPAGASWDTIGARTTMTARRRYDGF